MSQDNDMLEIHPGAQDGPSWAAKILERNKEHEDDRQSKAELLDNESLFNLTLYYLERELFLGAARTDIGGMLKAAESLLKIRDIEMPLDQKEALLDMAGRALEKNPITPPPLSAFIRVELMNGKSSKKMKRISWAFTLLLLTAAPTTTTVKTLSDQVMSAISPI